MKILVYSETSAKNLKSRLGTSEYSYYFVLKEFLPVLETLGDVQVIEHPESEVDTIYFDCRKSGETCLFLSFSPPHRTLTSLLCPTIPVFAWEFDSIPHETWLGRAEEDWSWVIRLLGRAITHSDSTIAAARRVVDPCYPIINAPAPVWDGMAAVRELQPNSMSTTLAGRGTLFDTAKLDITKFLEADAELWHAAVHGTPMPDSSEKDDEPTLPVLEAEAQPARPAAPRMFSKAWWQISKRYAGAWYIHVYQGQPILSSEPEPDQISPWWTEHAIEPELFTPKTFDLELGGVVFTSVFNPYDGRKNWEDLLSAFCNAFADNEQATLVFKLTHKACTSAIVQMLKYLARLPLFRCRVVLLHGYLEDDQYRALVHATSFVVNASYGEGQCLPLMEYLSAGKPAIAPNHSGMSDYIDESIAFIVDSWPEATGWPHDPRFATRTCRRQISWASLRAAYLQAFSIKQNQPQIYARMATQAIEHMRLHCSREVVRQRLEPFLQEAAASCD